MSNYELIPKSSLIPTYQGGEIRGSRNMPFAWNAEPGIDPGDDGVASGILDILPKSAFKSST